jgi:hypothetical protein
MPLQMLFWAIYILAILFAWWGFYVPNDALWSRRAGGYTVLWVLVGLLGYEVFGKPIR